MRVNTWERDTLRTLGCILAEKSVLPSQKEKFGMWKALNGLKPARPMVLMYHIPWDEIADDFLVPVCGNPFLKDIEIYIRKMIYQYRNMPGDIIVPGFIPCPMVIGDSGYGVEARVMREQSAHYVPQITCEQDIAMIKNPIVTYDEKQTLERRAALEEIFEGILPVKIVPSHRGLWYAPWDLLVTLLGVQEALLGLILNPELIRLAMRRLVEAYHSRLDQYEKLNLLMLNNEDLYCTANGQFVGSGGYGFTDELPKPGRDILHVSAGDIWGCASAQIFSEVSPAMHEEFSLNFDMAWLERFGLSYYGCCEPLDAKIGILEKIPNLRKISMSPWVKNVEGAAERLSGRYVFSCKPNPSVFAHDSWDIEYAERQLRDVLSKARKHRCAVEVIMKDITTVRNRPERLWEWSKMADRLASEFG